MSEEQQQDPRFSSELSYLGMLDDLARNNVEQNERVESFGSNIWFPDIGQSFPNFGNSEFDRSTAKDDSLYINEDTAGVQFFVRGKVGDLRINVPETNLIDEFPEMVCKYTLAFENMCTRNAVKTGVIQFNIGVTWVTLDQVEQIADILQQSIEFPSHP
jgi:hypothetical protein|tara:strand:+ start:390 stop:866 length:477 start_codon:yes stop_codon:yes gene_type:complete